MTGAWPDGAAPERRSGRWMRRHIVGALLAVSAVPFLVLGSGAWIVFRRVAIEQTLALHRTMVTAHGAAIDRYLSEQLHALQLIAKTRSPGALTQSGVLPATFAALVEVSGGAFVDLGVIDDRGRHLAYVGPFDLMDRNYREAGWFRDVMAEGTTVSDVFLGYRQLPHSVIAVRQPSRGGWWILRATLDNSSLYGLVRSLDVGPGGDVYVVNREGVYQTPPAEGDVLGTSSVPPPSPYQGVRDERVAGAAGATRRVMTWVNAGRWLLVVQQPEAAIVAPVRRALIVGGLITLLALMLVLLAVAVVTSRLTRRLEDADRRLEAMYSDLLRSAKLASLGELATGLAHEINNPLATLTAEHTNVADVLEESDLPAAVRSAVATSLERCRRQVARCGRITARMLQFGRQSGTVLRPASLGPLVGEIGDMLGRRVRAAGATLRAAVEPDLPPVWLDPDELEQVLVNLVNNAMDAVSAGGTITISAARDGDALQLAVSDDGCGMPPRDLARVFQPFFTTKPAGRGTGLGLSVVYGIVQGWGATVSAESAVGKGTTMTIRLRRADGETEGRKDGETEGRKDGRTERQRVGRAERWTEGQDNGRSRWWKERSHD